MTDVEFYQCWLRALWKGIIEPIIRAFAYLIKLILNGFARLLGAA